MEENSSVRLSSDYLYHFKRDADVLRLILRNGFRHSSWRESLPFFNISQHSFTVCFCDIRFQESREHRTCYGNNGIALTKEWGIRNNVSPVRYIHRTSPGVTEEYIELKNLYRAARELSLRQPNKALLLYLVNCLLQDDNQLIQGATVVWDPATRERAQKKQQWISNLISSAAGIRIDGDVVKCLDLLMDKIHALHNELERRDCFMRAYQEDFECPATAKKIMGKVLYDEREWRSIVFLSESEILESPHLYETCVEQEFLPEQYNLRFSDRDVVAIIVENDQEKSKVRQDIESGQTFLTEAALPKLLTIGEFEEPSVICSKLDP